jgi:hypothetical protein
MLLLAAVPACLPAQPDGPTIRIVRPAAGVLNSSSAVVEVALTEYSLNPDAVGGAHVEGEGHWHLYLDGDYLWASASETTSVTALGVGSHTLRAELVQNDHGVLEPPAEAEVEIEVTAESRGLRFVAPGSSGGDPVEVEAGTDIEFSLEISNFTLDPDNVGGEAAPCMCEGHWHLSVDGTYVDAVTTADYTFEQSTLSLEPGLHTVEARLVQNDHAEVEPPVFDLLTLDVLAP